MKTGGVLKASTSEPPNLDLPQHSSPFVVNTVNPQYDQLVQWDPFEVGNIIPDIAHEWEFSDETTLVFHLVEADFHDGTPFTSEDVVNSLMRIKEPPEGMISPRQAQLRAIDVIETPDERTAVIRLARPSGSIIPTLGGTEMIMYSTKDILDDAFDHKERTNGTGPYMLDRWDRGVRFVLKRNPNYFVEELPYLDGIEWIFIPDAVQNFASFTTGDLDMAGIAAADRATVEGGGVPGTHLLTAPLTATWVTANATWNEPWTDPRTWVATSLCVDREALNSVISEGRGFTHHAIPPVGGWALSEEQLLSIPGYNGLGDGQEASMEERFAEARKLFEAAGMGDYTFDMFTWDTVSFENNALVIIDGMQQAGLRLGNFEAVDRGTYEQRLAAHEYPDLAAASRGATFPDPTPAYADSYITGSGRLYNGITDPEVDALFEQQEQTLDPDERREVAHRMMMRYLEVYPPEVTHFGEGGLGLWDHVQGYGELYGGFFQSRKMQWVWLDK